MKFLIATNADTNQTVYIPVERISSIRYPVGDQEHGYRTLITWTETDGGLNFEPFKEKPSEFKFQEV